jgi:thioester reductase-like protein
LPYSALVKSNVGSVREVLRLATTLKLKAVQFLSSVAALEGTPMDIAVPESFDITKLKGKHVSGYGMSKFVAEMICARARARGVPVVCFRTGYVGGNSKTHVVNYDSFWRLIDCMRTMKIFLSDRTIYPVVPADYLAKLMILLLAAERTWEIPVYHITLDEREKYVIYLPSSILNSST